MRNVRMHNSLLEAGVALAAQVQTYLQQALSERAIGTLAVPGGRSPAPFFQALFAAPLDWSRVIMTLTDERWCDPQGPDSNLAMLEHFRAQTPAQAARLLSLKSSHETPQEGCAEIAQRLAFLPTLLDVVVLGMGDDGHIASLFPGQPHDNGQAPCLPGLAPVSPHLRISLSQSRLLACRKHFFLVSGAAKLAVLQQDQANLPVHRFLRNLPHPAEIFHATA